MNRLCLEYNVQMFCLYYVLIILLMLMYKSSQVVFRVR